MGRQTLALFPQREAYENSPTQPAVWRRFQGYPRLIILGGGGATGAPPRRRPPKPR